LRRWGRRLGRSPRRAGTADVGALIGLLLGVGLLLIWRSGSRGPQGGPRANPGWIVRRTDLLRQSGVDAVSSTQLLAVQLLCGLIFGAVIFAITETMTVALCFAVFATFAPVVVLQRMRRRRQVTLRELWPEAIDNLASAVRAGMSLPEGLSALARRGPEPLRPPFARFTASYQATGRFGESLDGLKDDLSDPIGDRICETVRVAREVGGSDLGSVLRTLSELLRSDARTRAELETRQGWAVNSARLAVAAPWLVLLLLSSQSSTVRTFNSPGGGLLLAIGGVVCVAAYRMMLRIGQLPDEQRVLR
jgi:tight adherence protein B